MLPYQEVVRIILEISRSKERPIKRQLDARVLKHLISYSEHQFGDRIPGGASRDRGNGENIIDNWTAEIKTILPIYIDLISLYQSDTTLGMAVSGKLQFPYLKKRLDLLRPWSAYFDLNTSSRTDNTLNKVQTELLLNYLTLAEGDIGSLYTRRSQINVAENHCQRSLSFARLYVGDGDEYTTDLLCRILRTCYELKIFQGKFNEALIFVEEAYNCVAIAYNPVHPKVYNHI